MEEKPIGREEYIQSVLGAYRQTPGTAGTIRRPDRLLAAQLYARGVPLCAVENAFVLAAARRLIRPAECSTTLHHSLPGLLLTGDRRSARITREP